MQPTTITVEAEKLDSGCLINDNGRSVGMSLTISEYLPKIVSDHVKAHCINLDKGIKITVHIEKL